MAKKKDELKHAFLEQSDSPQTEIDEIIAQKAMSPQEKKKSPPSQQTEKEVYKNGPNANNKDTMADEKTKEKDSIEEEIDIGDFEEYEEEKSSKRGLWILMLVGLLAMVGYYIFQNLPGKRGSLYLTTDFLDEGGGSTQTEFLLTDRLLITYDHPKAIGEVLPIKIFFYKVEEDAETPIWDFQPVLSNPKLKRIEFLIPKGSLSQLEPGSYRIAIMRLKPEKEILAEQTIRLKAPLEESKETKEPKNPD